MSRRKTMVLAGVIIAAMLLALLFGLSDIHELKRRAHDIRWGWVGLAAIAAIVSHACIGLCQHALLVALGKRLPAELVVRVSLVGSVVARSLRSGGASGFAFVTWYFGRLGVAARHVASMVLGQLLLTNAVFASLAALGFLWLVGAPLVLGGPWPKTGLLVANAVVAVVLGGGFGFAWITLASPRLRAPWERRVERIAGFVGRKLKRENAGEHAREIFEEAATAVAGLVGGGSASAIAWSWAIVRVITSLLAFWLCVIAADIHVAAAGIVLAYVLGKMAGTFSLVPAGIGIIEGSLAGTLHAVGAPMEAALLAALLNRVAYHLVPGVVALAVFGPLARRVARQASTQIDLDGPAD